MQAVKEFWKYENGERVWVGKYKNSNNAPHCHDDCELFYVSSGKISVVVENVTYLLETGQSMLIEGGKLHHMHADPEGCILLMIVFDGALLEEIPNSLQSPLLTKDYALPALYDTLRAELLRKEYCYVARTEALITERMVTIYRSEQLKSREKPKTVDAAFQVMIAEMREKLDYYDFELAVSAMKMNRSYFSRFFHARMGIPFSVYLNRVKTARAVELLTDEEEYPMTEIAARCGFGTIRNFNRIFKENTGYAPSRLPKGYVYEGVPAEQLSTVSNVKGTSELLEATSSRE